MLTPGTILGLLVIVSPALAKPPTKAQRAFRAGVAAYSVVKFKAASQSFGEALELAPEWKVPFGFRALCRWTSGDARGAREDALAASRLRPASAEQFVARGMARYVLQDLPGAREDYQQAVRLNPSYALAYYGLGSALSSQGNAQEALEPLDKAVQLAPDSAVIRIVRGTVKDKLKQFRSAIDDYTKVIEINSRFAWARLYRGRDLREIQECRRATDDFTQFLKSYGPHEEALYLRANCYSIGGDPASAIKDLDRVLQLNPNRGLAWSNRGLAKNIIGDKSGALADLRKALELQPDKSEKIQQAIDAIEGSAKEPERVPSDVRIEPARRRESSDEAPLQALPAPPPEEAAPERSGPLPSRRGTDVPDVAAPEAGKKAPAKHEKVQDADSTPFIE